MMSTIEVKRLRHVIMYALGQIERNDDADKTMRFGEMWQCCSSACTNLIHLIPDGPDRAEFSFHMMNDLNALEAGGLVAVQRDEAKRMVHAVLTDLGRRWLSQVMFSHQDRLNKTQWSERLQ